MYAVIKTGGKQYKVAKGDSVFVEKLDVEAGEKVTFDQVILVSDGKDVKVGTPLVEPPPLWWANKFIVEKLFIIIILFTSY